MACGEELLASNKDNQVISGGGPSISSGASELNSSDSSPGKKSGTPSANLGQSLKNQNPLLES